MPPITFPLPASPVKSGNHSQSPDIRTTYRANNGTISVDNKSFAIKGINWFGFETDTHVVHGLWQRPLKDLVGQIKSLGFNSVRMPIDPEIMHGGSPKAGSIDYHQNTNLKGMSSLDILDAVVDECSRMGLHVLLDVHAPMGNQSHWLADLKNLAAHFDPIPGVMGIDILNEPHDTSTWGSGNQNTDWKLAAEKAAKVIFEAGPGLLVFIQGIGNDPLNSESDGHWWGGNLEGMKNQPLDLPKDRIVLSPHVYGPGLYMQSYFSERSFPGNMPSIWDEHFGFLQKAGYTVVVGEFGGDYSKPKSRQWQDGFVKYLDERNMGYFYWCLNPDSAYNEGLLVKGSNGKSDWLTVDTAKIASLKPIL